MWRIIVIKFHIFAADFMNEVVLWQNAFLGLKYNIDFVPETGLCVCSIKLCGQTIKYTKYLDEDDCPDYTTIWERGDQIACGMLFQITGNIRR